MIVDMPHPEPVILKLEGESLFKAAVRLNIPHHAHESDLYLPCTPLVVQLLKAHDRYDRALCSTFENRVEGGRWFDLPFLYEPFWDKVSDRARAARGLTP